MLDQEVLVVGAGPTGLTLALELTRRGIAVRVVDRAATPATDTRALGVQARTLELLERGGTAEALLARGLRADRFNVFSEGKRIVRAEFGGLPTAYPFLLMIPQPDVEGVLAQRLAESGVQVERELTLVAITPGDDRVEVTLTDAAGEERRRDYSWVVGADGAHSSVRSLLGVGFLGSAFEETFAVADLRMDWDRPPTEFFAFLNRGRFAAFFPMLGGWHRVAIAQPTVAEGATRGGVTLEVLQSSIDQTVPGPQQIAEVRQSGRFRINQRRAAAHRIGRVFLAGDAAHVHSVVGAQGMNTGMQDAFNLGWKLAEVIHGTADPRLLDSYEAERGPVAARLVKGTRRITRMTLLRNPLATAMRRTVAPKVLGRSGTQRTLTRAISQLDVSYHDDRAAAPAGRHEIGDRLPDVAVANQPRATRLHELLDPTGFTLLDFGVGDAVVASLSRAHRTHITAVDVSDAGAAAFEELGVDAPTLILVRPDGYLAARGGGPQIEAYLQQREPTNAMQPSDGAGR